MDGGPWWAAVHGVAKSRTRLSDFPSLHILPTWLYTCPNFIFSKVIVHVYITFIAVFFRCKQVKSRFITPFTSLDRSSNLVFISLNTVMKSPPLSNGMICLGMLKCVLYKVPLKINYVDASFSKPMTGHCKTADKPCKDRFSPSTGSV